MAGKNWSQIRKETDAGKDHDKVDNPDPAAAPLGTDEEAGGARTSPEAIEQAERHRRPAYRDEHKPAHKHGSDQRAPD